MPFPIQELFIFDNTHKLTNHLLKLWLKAAEEAIQARGCFMVALPGGKTPIEFFSKLAGVGDMDLWNRVQVFQTDERFVTPDSSESNYRIQKECLLDFLSIPQGNVHPFVTEAKDVLQAAALSQKHMMEFFQKIGVAPYFDLVILGLGEDGHTASLFPDYLPDEIKKDLVCAVEDPRVKHKRISLTFSAINSASQVGFLVTGRQKADIVKKMLEDHIDVPAGRVHPRLGKINYFLDKDAAQKLTAPKNFEHDGDAVFWRIT
ncbi:MAG: 6-phosphogluconolactonase [Candidatus Omnitrophica bacterium]|nr:6-phosphogluconolactonase [Candidatus Omnitrophota bacterium]